MPDWLYTYGRSYAIQLKNKNKNAKILEEYPITRYAHGTVTTSFLLRIQVIELERLCDWLLEFPDKVKSGLLVLNQLVFLYVQTPVTVHLMTT